ncbi:hypothetical protein DSL72_000685 [Monilinia vaccinii-corymbosi]|uniref:Uncharacterized protein n=1 Tax=Monilinia vaccinii-corymbosi TaxID=61207 RepID=A0A8A3P292_9HELO|nr:hypothetical protein DSL72_000685 [Monilinia vaccinii-corymbosi]
MGVGQQRRANQSPASSVGKSDQQQPPSVVDEPPAPSSDAPPSGGFDGTGERRQPHPFGQGVGFDPARDPKKEEGRKFNTRVELPSYRDNVSNKFCLFICNVLFVLGFSLSENVNAASRKYVKLHGAVLGHVRQLLSVLNITASPRYGQQVRCASSNLILPYLTFPTILLLTPDCLRYLAPSITTSYYLGWLNNCGKNEGKLKAMAH